MQYPTLLCCPARSLASGQLVVARYDEAKWFAMGPGDGHTFDDDGTGDGGALPPQDDEGKGTACEPVSVGLFDQASAPALAWELLV